MTDRYVLIGKIPRPEPRLMVWGRWMEAADRRVAHTVRGDVSVSTVFLGLDHQFNPGGRPLLFETLVFGGPEDGAGNRYSTWEEAEEGHAEMCRRAISKAYVR